MSWLHDHTKYQKPSTEHLSLTKNNQALRKIEGSPAYDLYEKNQDFLVTLEQKSGTKGHQALLEHSPDK